MKKFISSSINKDLKESVKIAEELGLGLEISRLPNFVNIDSNIDGIISNIQKTLFNFNGKKTLHGMFFDLSIASQDVAIRKISRTRHSQSLKIAKAIDAEILVFHSGYKAMKHKVSQNKFKENSIIFWKEFIKEFEDANITAVIENVLESTPNLILDIINGVNSPYLKASIDTGHANLVSKTEIPKWIETYDKNLFHMHLHNNFGDDDSHSSLLNGSIEFNKIFDTLIKSKIEPALVFEIFNKEELIESINYFNNYFGGKNA